MATTPRPWWTLRRQVDGVRIIVGPSDDNGEPHTVAEVHVCDDGTHPSRSHPDAELICESINWTARDERAEVVAWLRRQSVVRDEGQSSPFSLLAQLIENGEHRK